MKNSLKEEGYMNRPDIKIILSGTAGKGKTTIGKLLSKLTRVEFFSVGKLRDWEQRLKIRFKWPAFNK